MESNWRYNVAATGWTGGPYTLIARNRTGFFGTWLARVPGVPDTVFLLDDLGSDQVPVVVGVLPALSQGFPCGYAVDPD